MATNSKKTNVKTKEKSTVKKTVKSKENDILNDKILIEIAAYHDPELMNTVNSAIIQADNKDRVHFAVCYQGDDLTDYNKLKIINNCKIAYLTEAETKGLCYARNLCQHMIEDEKYIFQIDSHMRFVKHWDTKLIENLLSLKDEKAIISFYPPDFQEKMFTCPLDDPIYDNPGYGSAMYLLSFHYEPKDDYFLNITSLTIGTDSERAKKRVGFISGGNFFSFSRVHKEVFNDPKMFFYGDELAMSIRLFTYGWNVYNLGESYIYHQYNRKGQRFARVNDSMDKENDRFLQLIKIKKDDGSLGEFGLGKERTFEDFEKTFGLSFKNKTVYMNGETGEFDNDNYKNKISLIQKRIIDSNTVKDDEPIEVLVVDLFGNFFKCVDRCYENAVEKDRVKFIIGTTCNRRVEIKDPWIKSIDYFEEGTTYSQILSAISKKTSNSNVLVIDSAVRLLKEWDTILNSTLKKCGPSSVLTTWLWQTNDDIAYGGVSSPYFNSIKDFDGFYNNLPNLKYNTGIEIAKKEHPFFTPFISDGFIFANSKVFKNIPVDPNLNYEEHKFIYSVRLWTNGFNIYYPKVSVALRVKDEALLNDGSVHNGIICALMDREDFDARYVESNYEYGLGKERPLWTWYDLLSPDYDYKKDEETTE